MMMMMLSSALNKLLNLMHCTRSPAYDSIIYHLMRLTHSFGGLAASIRFARILYWSALKWSLNYLIDAK